MAEEGTSVIVRETWRIRRRWSLAAGRLKRRLGNARGAVLWLSIAGGALETLSAQLADRQAAVTEARWAAGIGAACLALAAFLGARFLGGKLQRDWITARSVSEALKKQVFLRLAAVPPYDGSGGRTPDEELVARRGDLVDAADAVHGEVAAVEAPQGDDAPSDQRDPDTYIGERVDEQVQGYYRRRARELASRLRLYRGAELVLLGTATVFGAMGAVAEGASLQAWVAALTTAGAALATHVAASRMEYELLSYERTASRLERLRDAWRARSPAARTEPARHAFVQACEEAISVENQAWMAEGASALPPGVPPST